MTERQRARVRAYQVASELLEVLADAQLVAEEGQAVVDEVVRIAESLAWRGERISTNATARHQFQARRERK